MVVKIRLKRGPVFRHEPGQGRRLALALAGVLSPASFIAAVLACWRLAADLHWAGKFAIARDSPDSGLPPEPLRPPGQSIAVRFPPRRGFE